MINENVSFSSIVTVKDANGKDTQVMTLYGTLDTTNMNMTINVNTMNKDLVAANAADVKAQYDDFRTTLEGRATALGFALFGDTTTSTAADTTTTPAP